MPGDFRLFKETKIMKTCSNCKRGQPVEGTLDGRCRCSVFLAMQDLIEPNRLLNENMHRCSQHELLPPERVKKLSDSWIGWKDEHPQSIDPLTLRAPADQREYLENRLWAAFMAGAKAGATNREKE